MDTIILNWLPPADTRSPSFCLSVLKSFMKRHGFNVEIIYWNLLFKAIPGTEEIPFAPIVPFLIEWNYRRGNSQSRIREILPSVDPTLYTDRRLFDSFVEQIHENVNGIIDSVLQAYIHRQEILLWGFSSKYYQWIPAAVVAESIKTLSPEATVVLGGMGAQSETDTLLRVCSVFDIGIWGEGEIPLQALCSRLRQDDPALESLPNVVFNDKGVVRSTHSPSAEPVDLNRLAIPDYDDYFAQVEGRISSDTICLPIERSRGCHWNRCRFCFLNEGYTYRVKESHKLLEEIHLLQERHGISVFALVDPDLVGGDVDGFSSLVSALSDYNRRNPRAVSFCVAEINPDRVETDIIGMMPQAGLKHVQIGFEAFSDSLLKKMNKRTSVAQNLHFVTHALRNGLSIQGANVVPGLPDETPDDIVESTENLHYFRFCLGRERLSISFSPFAMKSTTPYFKQLSKEERRFWCNSLLYDAFPPSGMMGDEKYDLFEFISDKNSDWWRLFRERLTYYLENTWSYSVTCDGDKCLFEESINSRVQRSMEFSRIHVELLQLLGREVCSLEDIYDHFGRNHTGASEKVLRTIVMELRDEYIVYANTELSEITSAISIQK
jgi:radical SAM superfamily enzyme YgiQ (UPF0313 family)